MSDSLVEFIESLGYVLIGVRDNTLPNAPWARPAQTNARDGLIFMSRKHKSRNLSYSGGVRAVRIDTLRLGHVLRANRDLTCVVANCARTFGLPRNTAPLKLDVRWSEYTARDEELIRALIVPRAGAVDDGAVDMLVIAHVECVM